MIKDFDNFLTAIEAESIVERINEAFKNLKPSEKFGAEDMVQART